MPRLSAALEGVAVRTNSEHSWIFEASLRRQAPVAGNAEWQVAFDGVITYTRRQGWVDEGTGAVRARIAWLKAFRATK